mgnify:CR=1 FL=1
MLGIGDDVRLAFDEIRLAGVASPQVTRRLCAALAYVGAPWSVIALVCGMFLVPYVYVRAKAILDARARAAGRQGSMLEDWTLLSVGLLFCAASVFTFLQSDWRMGVVRCLCSLGQSSSLASAVQPQQFS